jgi:hypothetical protein
MAGNFPWSALNSADTLCTGASMNALADGAGVIGSEIDNTSGKYTHMLVHIRPDTNITGSGLDSRVDLFILPAMDGTNYPDPPGSTAANVPTSYFAGSMSNVDGVGAGAAQTFRDGQLMIPIPPCKFKLEVVNELGNPFPSNNNTVVEGFRFTGAYT